MCTSSHHGHITIDISPRDTIINTNHISTMFSYERPCWVQSATITYVTRNVHIFVNIYVRLVLLLIIVFALKFLWIFNAFIVARKLSRLADVVRYKGKYRYLNNSWKLRRKLMDWFTKPPAPLMWAIRQLWFVWLTDVSTCSMALLTYVTPLGLWLRW